MSVCVEVQIEASTLADHFGDYWTDFAEFMDRLHMRDGQSTIRGQARAIADECGNSVSAISAYLRLLADAIDEAEKEAEE